MLKVSSCSKGFSLINSQCFLNKNEWSQSVAEIDEISGIILACVSGYYYSASNRLCLKKIPNCAIYTNPGKCTICELEDNVNPYILVNDGKLCISAEFHIANCLEYNDSGFGCKICENDLRGLEDKGCVPPPFCSKVE
jgi:hypothetical protein